MGKKVYDEMFKQQLVKEAIETRNAILVGRKHGVSPNPDKPEPKRFKNNMISCII